jgi:hypothetical protein
MTLYPSREKAIRCAEVWAEIGEKPLTKITGML